MAEREVEEREDHSCPLWDSLGHDRPVENEEHYAIGSIILVAGEVQKQKRGAMGPAS